MYMLSSFRIAAQKTVKDFLRHARKLPETGFFGFRRACQDSCLHHFDPLNGLLVRALDLAEKKGLDDKTYKTVARSLSAKAHRYETYFYKPVFKPFIAFVLRGTPKATFCLWPRRTTGSSCSPS